MSQVPSNSTAQASLRLIHCLSSPFQILLIQKCFLFHLIDSLLLHVFLGFTYSICSANLVLFLCHFLNVKAFTCLPSHLLYTTHLLQIHQSHGQKHLSLYPLYLPEACHRSLETALSTEVFKHYSARIYFK